MACRNGGYRGPATHHLTRIDVVVVMKPASKVQSQSSTSPQSAGDPLGLVVRRDEVSFVPAPGRWSAASSCVCTGSIQRWLCPSWFGSSSTVSCATPKLQRPARRTRVQLGIAATSALTVAAAASSASQSRSALTKALRRDQAKLDAKTALSPSEQREAAELAMELAKQADAPRAAGTTGQGSYFSGVMSKELSGAAAAWVPAVLAGSVVLCGVALVVFAVRRATPSE